MKHLLRVADAFLLVLVVTIFCTKSTIAQNTLPIQTPLTFAGNTEELKPVRGEYESTAQFESRCAEMVWDPEKVIYLILDSLTTWASSNYDADSEMFSFYLSYGNQSNNYTTSDEACDISDAYLTVLQRKAKNQGKYISQNAFGVSVNVTKRKIEQALVAFDRFADDRGREIRDGLTRLISIAKDSVRVKEKEWLSGSSPSSPELQYWISRESQLIDSLNNLSETGILGKPLGIVGMKIPVARKHAKVFRQNVRMVLGVTLSSLLDDICISKRLDSPTLNNPYEDEITEYLLRCDLIEVVAYDNVKKQVLKKAKIR